jgi:hypothetical protein
MDSLVEKLKSDSLQKQIVRLPNLADSWTKSVMREKVSAPNGPDVSFSALVMAGVQPWSCLHATRQMDANVHDLVKFAYLRGSRDFGAGANPSIRVIRCDKTTGRELCMGTDF